MMSKMTMLYKNKVEIFANKHINRIILIRPRYILFQGKGCTLALYYSGRIYINNKKVDFGFSEKEIEKYM